MEQFGVGDDVERAQITRELVGEEKYVEVAYLADELPSDLSTFDVVADTELLHRFGDCKLMSPEIDPSSTPPMASWEWAVEGEKYIDYNPA